MTLRRLAAPLALTLLAAFLRYQRFVDFYPNVDHAYPIAQAIQGLQSGRWPGLGQMTSVLFANPAGMSYLMVLPSLIFGALWGAHFFTVSLNLLAVPLTYAVVRQRLDARAALAAGLLVAVNPWLIYFSMGTWVQGLLVFWSALTFGLLTWAVFGRSLRRRSLFMFAALAALTGLTQMYLLAALTLLPVAVILWLRRRHVAWRGFLAGLALFGAAAGTYAYQLAADWPNQSGRLQNFMHADAPQVRVDALESALRFVTGRDYELAWGNDGTPAWQVRRAVGLSISWVLTAVIGLGVVRAVWRVVTHSGDSGFWLAALAWWGLPVALLTVQRQPVQIAYLLLTVPAGFVLAAPVLARTLRDWRRSLALAALLGLNSFVLLHASRVQTANQPAALGLDTLSVRGVVDFQRTARQLAEQYGLSEFYVGLDSHSLTAKVGRELTAVNWFQLPAFEILQIDRPTVYVDLRRGSPGEPVPLAERAAVIPYAGGDYVTFDLIPAYRRVELTALTQHPVEWPTVEGLTLVGYDLAVTQNQVVAYWTVDTLDPRRLDWLLAPFLHLVNARGELIRNVGAPTLPGSLYRAGDVYRFVLPYDPVPPGAYELGLGLFDGVHGFGVTLLPPGAEPRPAFTASITVP